MLTEDAFKLLKKTPPFAFLDNAALKNMTREMLMEFYPKGHTIYRQDGSAAEHLRPAPSNLERQTASSPNSPRSG